MALGCDDRNFVANDVLKNFPVYLSRKFVELTSRVFMEGDNIPMTLTTTKETVPNVFEPVDESIYQSHTKSTFPFW